MLFAFGILPPPLKSKKQYVKKELNQQELMQCKNILDRLREHMLQHGKNPRDFVNQLRRDNQPGCSRSDFKSGIGNYCIKQYPEDLKSLIPSEAVFFNLCFYLVREREDPEMVSFEKLIDALERGRDVKEPLKQEGLGEIRQYKDKLNRQLTSGGVKTSLIELDTWLKLMDKTLDQVLQLKSTAQNMKSGDFIQALKTAGFTIQNEQELILHCSKGSGSDAQISISHVLKELRIIKQQREGGGEKEKKATNLPIQIKRNLELLSDHL